VRRSAKIPLLLAGLLLTLHSLTPHTHTTPGEPVICEYDDCGVIGNWIQQFFDLDLGEGHLEFFIQSEADNYQAIHTVSLIACVAFFPQLQSQLRDDSIRHYPSDEAPPEACSREKELLLRGPPFFV
jgi:hypothetical protein